ncbi:MAG: hypothetical protein LAQ69_20370 [Acidobacteriia bacterium]|nr:hypothetical protein [Terriglobia bacterium]
MPPHEFRPATFDQEESADLRRQYVRHALRLAIAFAVLFAAVYLAFRWSGAAVRFGASRVGDRGVATWHVIGAVRNAATHQPIPWVSIDDDPSGRPPFFHADADHWGEFDLVTLAEPHRIRISATGYRTVTVNVGRVWFLWLPSGKERYDTELVPE